MLNKPNGRSVKGMKRLLVSLLVAACILATAAPAFAATFPDTEGTKYEAAVGLLSELGLLKGYEDGTFKPAGTITRAEVCAVAIRAFGLEAAAEQAAGTTVFSDVPATHWAAGYVNIAADMGLIKGYPEGTFKPEAPVTYAEALTIIIRLLNHHHAVTGSWPVGYLVKAYELGIPTGVTFSPNAYACRGDVAIFLNNALTVPTMEQVWSGAIETWATGGPTLLDKLGYICTKGVVTALPTMFEETGLGSDEIEIETDLGTNPYTYADFSVDLLGMPVRFWHDGNNNIISLDVTAGEDDLVTGYISDIDSIDKMTYIEINPVTHAKLYLATGADLYYNNQFASDLTDFDGAEFVAVLDSEGDIASLIATEWDNSIFVTKTREAYYQVSGKDETPTGVSFDLDDGYAAYVVVKDGVLGDIEDIAVGDVVHCYVVTNGDKFVWMQVVSDAVTGELEEVATNADEDIILDVDGEEYVVGVGTYSTDNNYLSWDVHTDETTAEVTLYLDKDGYVRHVAGDVEPPAPDALVGVVSYQFYDVTTTDPTEPTSYYLKVFTTEGETVKLQLGDEFDWTEGAGTTTYTLPTDWATVELPSMGTTTR